MTVEIVDELGEVTTEEVKAIETDEGLKIELPTDEGFVPVEVPEVPEEIQDQIDEVAEEIQGQNDVDQPDTSYNLNREEETPVVKTITVVNDEGEQQQAILVGGIENGKQTIEVANELGGYTETEVDAIETDEGEKLVVPDAQGDDTVVTVPDVPEEVAETATEDTQVVNVVTPEGETEQVIVEGEPEHGTMTVEIVDKDGEVTTKQVRAVETDEGLKLELPTDEGYVPIDVPEVPKEIQDQVAEEMPVAGDNPMTKDGFRDWIAERYEEKLAELKAQEQAIEDEEAVNANSVKELEDCIEQAADKKTKKRSVGPSTSSIPPYSLSSDWLVASLSCSPHQISIPHSRRSSFGFTMGDVFLRAMAADLERTQRALPPLCLFCVPQPRALLADEPLTQDALRPLEGGIEVPEDPSEIDVATFRKYTAILRSFPENELVFYQLEETISQVHKICVQEHVYERYQQTLPANLREEWEAAVEELIHAGSFDDVDEDYRLQRRHGGGVSHLLQIQQVVECYLMESVHEVLFPRVVASCQEQDRKLQQVMYRLRHYTPEDFGLRKEFQVRRGAKEQDGMLGLTNRADNENTLLVFKACIDRISDAITRNVKLRRLDFGMTRSFCFDVCFKLKSFVVIVEAYQLTTDDILDQLLFVLVQSYNEVLRKSPVKEAGLTSSFPLAAVIKYISDYHFINSNTTALGFTIANFQVAIEYFVMRGDHEKDCKNCADLAIHGENDRTRCSQIIEESNCVQAAHRIRQDLINALESVELARRDTGTETGQESVHPNVADFDDSVGKATSMRKLSIIGEWSLSTVSGENGNGNSIPTDRTTSGLLAVNPVEFVVDGKRTFANNKKMIQISGGQRFFAAITEDGNLFTWGDCTGGRLGYTIADGDSRQVSCPQQVFALQQQIITQVACGAFHTLVTDLNGHVFAWGSNSRGQLGFLPSISPLTAVASPSVVTELRGTYMSSVACGEYHSLALSSDGRVFSWGCNKYGKLGRQTEGLLDMVPRPINRDWTGWSMDMKSRIGNSGDRSAVRRIAAGKDHSLAISSDGVCFSWGRGDSGQLGHGCYMDVSEPKQMMTISAVMENCEFVDIAGGNDFSLMLLHNGTACICGRDPALDSDKLHLSPVLLSLPLNLEREFFGKIVSVSCGEAHYALLAKSGVLLQSYASFSQPLADAGSTTTEVQERRVAWVKEAGTVRRMVCGASHTLALC
ncbi:unnamed protein product [Phytophthora fragariaefolia]|uniref:Unnamed protein product n=1 Tax=Phytophthora fragariaefolia TaxID=1490495 RepID=A0A9W7DAC9_9STRA|nr:unnamed protein product [Phytophthora fragariaefolia]